MSKGAYIGVNNVAHKIKKGYIGVNGVARRIKKAYIGIGGVARPCWSGGELVYYGTAPKIVNAGSGHQGATHISDEYALFGGGWRDSHFTGGLDAYTKTLSRITPTQTLSYYSMCYPITTNINNYAIFATINNINVYDLSLTKTVYANNDKEYLSSITHVGNYIIFFYVSYIEAYNSSLTLVLTTNPSVNRSGLASTHIGNYALFGGGAINWNSDNGQESAVVDVFDTSLTHTTTTNLSIPRSNLAATHVGSYAIFAGGAKSYDSTLSTGTPYSTVDVFDTSLTHTTATNLSVARFEFSGTHISDEYAIFSGGSGDYINNPLISVDAYDISLTRSTISTTSLDITSITKGTYVGNYALFVSYKYNSSGSDVENMQVFTIK